MRPVVPVTVAAVTNPGTVRVVDRMRVVAWAGRRRTGPEAFEPSASARHRGACGRDGLVTDRFGGIADEVGRSLFNPNLVSESSSSPCRACISASATRSTTQPDRSMVPELARRAGASHREEPAPSPGAPPFPRDEALHRPEAPPSTRVPHQSLPQCQERPVAPPESASRPGVTIGKSRPRLEGAEVAQENR
jgi:hypothetical protein